MTAARPIRHRTGRLARALVPMLLALQAAWLPAGAAQAQAQAQTLTQALAPAIDGQVARHYPGLERLYQDLHAHPELGFQEVQTAAKLAAAMRAAGFTVTEQVGRTGLVAMLRNGPGPTILVRTDMDALPMEEKTVLPYASRVQVDHLGRNTFVAHSCRHDLHMAGWVGTALTLAALKDRWQGTLMFIAQPAEELLGGTLRSYDPAVRTKLRDGLRRTALATAGMAGAPEPQLKLTPGGDATINDPAVVGHAETALKAAFGAQVKRLPPITPSEDFAEFGSAGVPSMFFLVGVLDPKDVEAARAPGGKPLPGNHSPFFAPVPEPSIKTAVKAMSLAVLSALQR